MNRQFLLSFLLLSSLAGFSQDVVGLKMGEYSDLYDKIVSYGPRIEGSPGEKSTLKFIQTQLSQWGIPVQSRDFSGLAEAGSFSSSLDILIPGKLKDRMILVIPLDQKDEAAPGGGISITAGLAMAHYFTENPLDITLQILFLGGERGDLLPYPLGSRAFLQDYYPEAPVGVFYLDAQSPRGNLRLQVDSLGRAAPIWMVKGLTESFQGGDFTFLLEGSHPPLIRLSLAEGQSVLDHYFQKEIPGILITSGDGTELSPEVWIREMIGAVERFITRYKEGLPATWDRHYLLFQWQDQFMILDQKSYIILLLITIGIILILIFIRPEVIRERFFSVIKHSWQLPLIFIALFLFLYAATWLLQNLITWRDFPSLWKFYPSLFLSLKLAVGFFLYYLLFFIFRRMPLIRWSTFYVFGSLAVTTVLTVLSLFTGLANSFYFLWTLVLTVLFALWNNRYWRLGLLILMPLWFIKAVGELFIQTPDFTLINAVLFSPVEGNLVLTLLTFPLILLVSAYHYVSHKKRGRNEQSWNEIFMMISALLSIVLGFTVAEANPFLEGRKIPLYWVDDQSENSREIRISSPVAWPEALLAIPGESLPLIPQLRESLYEVEMIPGITFQSSVMNFLDRKTWSLVLNAPGQPQQLKLQIRSESELVIYSCSFPYRILPGSREAEVFVGRNPPLPFKVDLTVGRTSSLNLVWNLEYGKLPYGVTGLPENRELQGTLNIRKTQTLSGDKGEI